MVCSCPPNPAYVPLPKIEVELIHKASQRGFPKRVYNASARGQTSITARANCSQMGPGNVIAAKPALVIGPNSPSGIWSPGVAP